MQSHVAMPRLLPVILVFLTALLLPWQLIHAQDSYTWKNARIAPGGFVSGLIVHPGAPDLKYCRTDVGGAYRYDAATGTWAPINDELIMKETDFGGVEAIAVSPSDANIVFVSGGHDIWKSTNKGSTWTPAGLNVYIGANDEWRSSGERIGVDPNNGGQVVYFGTRRDGLFRSTNGGTSFAAVSLPSIGDPANGISFIVFDKNSGSASANSQTIYVGVSGAGVYKSTNGGSSWALLSGGPSASLWPQRAALDSAGNLYVTYQSSGSWNSPTGGAIYRFTPGGSASNITPANRIGFCAIAVDPTNDSQIVAAQFKFSSGNKIYRSTNAGASWSQVSLTHTVGSSWWPNYVFSTGFSSIVIDPANAARTWVSDGFSVWRCDNNSTNSQHFNPHGDGIEEFVGTHLRKVPGGPLLAAVMDMSGFTLTDLTQAPSEKWNGSAFAMGTGIDLCASMPQYATQISSHPDGTTHTGNSSDGGLTWAAFGNIPRNTSGGRIAVSATNPNNMVWVTVNGSNALVSFNRGASWSTTNLPISGYLGNVYTTHQGLAADQVNGSTFYFYDKTQIFWRSTDGGANWTSYPVPVLPWHWKHCLKAVPGTEGELWISFHNDTSSGQGPGLYRSTDGGVNWVKVQGNRITHGGSIAFGKAAPGYSKPALFLFGEVDGVRGMYRSDDATSLPGDASGATWVSITGAGQFVPPPVINGTEGDPEVHGKVYIATGGRGVMVGTKANTNQVAAPAYSPAAGSFTSAQSVTISSATTGATIRYTTDGSTPSSTHGTVYSGAIQISQTTTLRSVAYKSGMIDSDVTTGVFTIDTGSGGGGTLPAGWVAADIGTPSPSGSTSYDNGAWTLTGGGPEIFGRNDHFHFAYTSSSGDTTIIARVESVQNTASAAKGGVMIRASNANNAVHAMCAAYGTNEVAMVWRNNDGGRSWYTSRISVSLPVWVRMKRTGDNFTAGWSSDGVNWNDFRTETFAMPQNTISGLAVTSGVSGTGCTAVITNQSITSP